MNKFLWSTFLVLLAFAWASAQTENGVGAASAQSKNRPSQAAQPEQTGPGTKAGSDSLNQANNSSGSVPGAPGDTSHGGIAGAAGSAAGNIQVPETPQSPSATAGPSDSDLQAQVQNALSKEPTLSGDNVNVAVSGDSIDINGSVATAREKQTATRIVQSYAGNKKVVSHLTITGRNRSVSPAATSPTQNREEKGTGTGDVSAHPEPNKGVPAAKSSRPPG